MAAHLSADAMARMPIWERLQKRCEVALAWRMLRDVSDVKAAQKEVTSNLPSTIAVAKLPQMSLRKQERASVEVRCTWWYGNGG